MKIDQLIKKLEKIKKEKGNINVFYKDHAKDSYGDMEVKAVVFRYGSLLISND